MHFGEKRDLQGNYMPIYDERFRTDYPGEAESAHPFVMARIEAIAHEFGYRLADGRLDFFQEVEKDIYVVRGDFRWEMTREALVRRRHAA